MEQYKRAMFVAAKVARRVKVEASSVNLKVSQRVALFKLVAPVCQDHARIGFLLALNPSLRDLVRFDGSRWVSIGLEKDVRDCISSASVPDHQGKAPNILRSMAQKVPNCRPQLGPLRVSPDDVPALGPVDKSSMTKDFWSKVWDKRPSVPSGDREKFQSLSQAG